MNRPKIRDCWYIWCLFLNGCGLIHELNVIHNLKSRAIKLMNIQRMTQLKVNDATDSNKLTEKDSANFYEVNNIE